MSSPALSADPTMERLDAIDARLERLEQSVARLTGLLDQATDTFAMAADTADDWARKGAQRGVDLEERLVAGVDALERLTEPKTLRALLQLAESADGLGTAVHFASKLDDHMAMAADTFDGWAATQAARGVDVEARILAIGDTLDRLTAPGTLEALVQLAESADGLGTAVHFASKLDDHMAMAADTFDSWAVAQADRGIDLEDRMRALTSTLEALTEPSTIGLLTTAMDAFLEQAKAEEVEPTELVRGSMQALARLSKHSETLFDTGILADDTVTVLGNIGAALPRAVGERPQPVGLFGLLSALRQPEVQRALGLGVALATQVGAALDQPSHLLEHGHR